MTSSTHSKLITVEPPGHSYPGFTTCRTPNRKKRFDVKNTSFHTINSLATRQKRPVLITTFDVKIVMLLTELHPIPKNKINKYWYFRKKRKKKEKTRCDFLVGLLGPMCLLMFSTNFEANKWLWKVRNLYDWHVISCLKTKLTNGRAGLEILCMFAFCRPSSLVQLCVNEWFNVTKYLWSTSKLFFLCLL